MDWLMNLLGMGGSPTMQQPHAGVDPQGGAALPQTGMQAPDASRSAGGAKPGAMAPEMAKLLMASLMADPAKMQMPGAVAPGRPVPFVYAPTKAMPVGANRLSLRGY